MCVWAHDAGALRLASATLVGRGQWWWNFLLRDSGNFLLRAAIPAPSGMGYKPLHLAARGRGSELGLSASTLCLLWSRPPG